MNTEPLGAIKKYVLKPADNKVANNHCKSLAPAPTGFNRLERNYVNPSTEGLKFHLKEGYKSK